MAIQIQGNGGTVSEVEASRAVRVTPRPVDVGALGAYRVGVLSGATTGLAANTPVFSMRWGNSTNLALIQRVYVKGQVVTGFTAAQEIVADVIIARSFTASDSAGTAVTLSGNNQKKRTSFGTSLVTDMRISTTATLTAGTRTLDSQAVAIGVGWTPAAATTLDNGTVELEFNAQQAGGYPIILAQDEGIIVRNVVAEGAGGTIRFAVTVDWLEVASY